MNNEMTITLPKKIKKITRTIKIITTVAVMAMAVYTMIPKSDKIEHIDTDVIIKSK